MLRRKGVGEFTLVGSASLDTCQARVVTITSFAKSDRGSLERITNRSPEFATSTFGTRDGNPVPSLDLSSDVSIAVT